MAVYDLELSNIPDGLGNATTEALLQEVRKLKVYPQLAWMRSARCWTLKPSAKPWVVMPMTNAWRRLPGALGVDEILTGKLSEEADGRMMVLKRIDQRRAQIRTTFGKRLNIGNGEEFLLSLAIRRSLRDVRIVQRGVSVKVFVSTRLRLSCPMLRMV